MSGGIRKQPGAATLALLLLLAAPAAGRGDGWTASAEVNASSGTTTTTDVTGRTTDLAVTTFPQRYRLAIDKQFLPFLLVNASAFYQWTPSWTSSAGSTIDTTSDRWNVFASMVLGPPVLNFTPFYLRRQEFATTRDAAGSVRTPTLVNQSYGLYGNWTPAGLPIVSMQLSRTEDFDLRGYLLDRTSDQLLVSLSYLDVKSLTLLYSLRWARVDEAITRVVSTDLSQSAQVSWADSFWDQRLTTAISYSGALRFGEVQASGAGVVTLQQFAAQGLSLVEAFPATPSQDTLQPNPALIDGDVVASAGIDVGYGPSMAGDQSFRDLGVGFLNSTTEVNLLWLWVDRQLPPSVAQAYSFSVWASEDNVVWIPVPLSGPVTFGVFDNRFELSIAASRARYLKVVTKPLAAGVTIDPRYATVLVTELQAYISKPANEIATSSRQYGGNLSGNARLLILRDWDVTYQLAFSSAHDDKSWFQNWSLQNTLTAGKTLAPGFSVSALVGRTDSGQVGFPHTASNRWSLQASYAPIPTFGASINYSGQVGEFQEGVGISNALTLVGRVDPFQGVSVAATGNIQWAVDVDGRRVTTPGGSVSVSILPVPVVALNGTWSIIANPVFTPGGQLVGQYQNLLQGSVSFSPVRAIYFVAGVTRSSYSGQQDQTLVNFSGGFSPFAGGQLLVRFGYDESYDTTARVRSRIFGPGLRWNVRPGIFVDASYIWNNSIQPTLLSQARTLFATLFISL